jgi:predicted DNA binding CopG/RHH family protein
MKIKKKAAQILTPQQLKQGTQLTTEQAVRFLENFRKFSSATSSRSKLISLKVPESLLEAFRLKAESRGLKYQTQIKHLMEVWLRDS